MFNKKISLLFAVAVLTVALAFAPFVFAAPPGSSQLKIFTRDRATIESAVNDWLENQKNTTVDQIKASAYGNDYAVLISYRGGGGGKVLTRVKIFDSNALSGGAGDNDKTPEARGQEFVSLLSENQIIRFADILAGSGPWDIFVVYDEYNPIMSLTSEEQGTSIIEKAKSFIENLVNPSVEQSPADSSVLEKSSEGQNATTTTATATTSPAETILPSPSEATSSPTETALQVSRVNSLLATVGILSLGMGNMSIGIVVATIVLLLILFTFSRKNKKKKTKR